MEPESALQALRELAVPLALSIHSCRAEAGRIRWTELGPRHATTLHRARPFGSEGWAPVLCLIFCSKNSSDERTCTGAAAETLFR